MQGSNAIQEARPCIMEKLATKQKTAARTKRVQGWSLWMKHTPIANATEAWTRSTAPMTPSSQVSYCVREKIKRLLERLARLNKALPVRCACRKAIWYTPAKTITTRRTFNASSAFMFQPVAKASEVQMSLGKNSRC